MLLFMIAAMSGFFGARKVGKAIVQASFYPRKATREIA